MPAQPDTKPYVSIIIPVYNDNKRLAQCLEALEEQTYAADRYEIVVVDDGSDELLDISPFHHVRLLHQNKPGAYAARNRGVAAAQGDYLAFTDSDCIPLADWLEKGVEALRAAPDCGLVGGEVILFYRGARPQSAAEMYQSLFAFPMENYIEKQHFCPTCNLFTFRHLFERNGLFDENLMSSGDFAWTRALYQKGYPLLYDPHVCIRHPALYTLKQLYRKTIRLAGGDVGVLKKQSGRSYRLNYRLYRDLKPHIGALIKIWSHPGFSTAQKFQVSFVLFYMQTVKFLEKMRISLGVGSGVR